MTLRALHAPPAPALAAGSHRATTLPSLTGLRWVAAALVFLCHVTVVGYFRGEPQAALKAVFGVGATGVSLFFVLSGFVLAWSHDDRTTVRSFHLRRFARVWPAHVVVVAAVTAAGVVVASVPHPAEHPVADLANVLLVSAWVPAWSQAGNPVAWSLVCEAFFYAMFPLLWRAWRNARPWVLVGSAVAAYAAVWLAPLALVAVHLVGSGTAASYHPLARWPEFALGVIVAVAMRRGLIRGARRRTAMLAVAVGYGTAAALGVSRATAVGLTVLGFVLLVSALARADREGAHTGLAGRTAVHLGTVSYAFYLVHLLVLGLLAAGRPGGHPMLPVLPAVGLTLTAFVGSLLLAEVTHRGVERPARRWVLTWAGRRATRRRTRPCPRPGAAGGTV